MTCSAKYLRTGVFACALAIAAVSSASGSPIYAVELDNGAIDLRSSTALSERFEFHSAFEGTNFYSRTGSATASAGELHASAQGTIQLTPAVNLGQGTVLNGTDALAAFVLDDVIIGGAGATVPGSFNMHLDGGLATDAFAQLSLGNGGDASAFASVTVGVSINGNFFSGTKSQSSVWSVSTQSGDGSTFEDGLLIGFPGDGGLTTPIVMLPVGTPFRLALSLYVSEDTTTNNTILGSRRQAEASSLFDNTLSFPLVGPVFNLPDGYTVQSAAGLIVDNSWQGAAAPDSDPVPEPTSVLLAGAGLSYLALRFRSRRGGGSIRSR